MSNLVKYNAARIALAEAHQVDEVKDIRDKSEAMAAYARQAKDKEMLVWVTEIKVRAERRAGQLLAEMPKNQGTKGQLAGGNTIVPPENYVKTLADLGISKNESSRWQKLAGVSDEKFEHAVAAAKEVAGEVTTAAMLRAANPAPVVAAIESEDEYTELDAAHDQISGLQDQLAAAILGEVSEDDKDNAKALIESLRERIKTLEATLKAVTTSRDTYMNENAELRRQITRQRKEIDKVTGRKTA